MLLGSQHRAVNRISMAHKKPGCSSSSAVPKRRGRGLATPSECQHGVTAVLFHGDGKLASAGAVDGLGHSHCLSVCLSPVTPPPPPLPSSVVKLWDLRRTYSTCRVEPPPAWHVFHTAADHSSSSSSNGRSFGECTARPAGGQCHVSPPRCQASPPSCRTPARALCLPAALMTCEPSFLS